MDSSVMSLIHGSFYVDPSDGLCTWTDPEYLSRSSLSQSGAGQELVDFRVGEKETTGSANNCTESAEDSSNDMSNSDLMSHSQPQADTAYIAVDNQDILQPEESDNGDVMYFRSPVDLSDDLRFVLSMPEMCDVTFLVGKTKSEVHGVKAILATRSKFFSNLIMSHQHNEAKRMADKRSKKAGLFGRLFRRKQNTSYEKMCCKTSRKLQIPVDEFDVDIFHRVVVYLHSGRVNINLQSVIGVMNAADTYCLPDLKSACFQFAQTSIQVNTVLSLLVSTEAYPQYKWTRILAQRIFEFISTRAEEVLLLPEFEYLPKSTAVMVLLRRDLRAAEEIKWTAALQWSRRYCEKKSNSHFRRTMKLFAHTINYGDLPIHRLEREVRPMGVVPDDVINQAIAKQTRHREVIGQELPRVAPPKPPRRKPVQQTLQRSAASAAAILAPIRGFVRMNSSGHSSSNRRSQCYADQDLQHLQ